MKKILGERPSGKDVDSKRYREELLRQHRANVEALAKVTERLKASNDRLEALLSSPRRR